MTNLQNGSAPLTGTQLRRLWLWGPIAAGATLTALLGAVVLLPLWRALTIDSQRLATLEEKRDEVQRLRGELKRIDVGEQKARTVNARLFRLISGNGDLSTFLAKLDQVGRTTGVQLDRYEPKAEEKGKPAAAGAPPAGGQPAAGTPPPATREAMPLEVQGLQRHDILLTARGSFPALLTFLRQVEALNVLVAQEDLSLSLEEPSGATAIVRAIPWPVVLRMQLSLYASPSGEDGSTPASRGRPGGTPPPPAAPPPPATPAR